MDGFEEIIIRRNEFFFKCPVCKKKYASNFPRCPHCFGNFGIKYYFKNEKEEMKEFDNIKQGINLVINNLREINLVKTECEIILKDILFSDVLSIRDNLFIEEKWITSTTFFLETQICSAGYIGMLFRKDPDFFERCGKKEGKNYYIKKDTAIDYLKRNSHGRLLNNIKKYLKERERKCQTSENQKSQNSNQMPVGKPLC